MSTVRLKVEPSPLVNVNVSLLILAVSSKLPVSELDKTPTYVVAKIEPDIVNDPDISTEPDTVS